MPTPKFSLQSVQAGLRSSLPDESLTQKAITEIQKASAAETSSGGGGGDGDAPEKKTYTVLRPDDTTEIAWVIAHPESIPAASVPERIREAISLYRSGRGRKNWQIESIGDAIERIPARHFSHFSLQIKSKLPVTLLAIANKQLQPSKVE